MVHQSQCQARQGRGHGSEQADNLLRVRAARDAPEPRRAVGGAGGEVAGRVEGEDCERAERPRGAKDTPPPEPARLRESEEAGLRSDQDVRLRVPGAPSRHVLRRGLRNGEDVGTAHGGLEVRQRRLGDRLHACERYLQGFARE